MNLETVLYEVRDGVATVTLNRPDAMNAWTPQLSDELSLAMGAADADDDVRAVVLTGAGKAFCAGADLSAGESGFLAGGASAQEGPRLMPYKVRKPVIAAVAGYALGGGCELAMMCDFILAADTAKFGQPEIKLGVIPGSGGTQRLPRAVGKAKAMEMVLTGRMMDAVEAERAGLVSRIVAADRLLVDAIETATIIAGMSLPATMMAKESVNRAYESSLTEGVLFERRVFHSCFAMEDQKEGMAAFVEKRKAVFKHR